MPLRTHRRGFRGEFQGYDGKPGLDASDPGLGFATKLNRITERGFKSKHEGVRLYLLGEGASIHPRSTELFRELRRCLAGFIMRIVAVASGLGFIREGIDPQRFTCVVINMIGGLLYLDDPADEPFTRLDILQVSIRALLGGVRSPIRAETLKECSLFSRLEVMQ